MSKELIHTFAYFALFEYAPSFKQLWLFNKKHISQIALRKTLTDLVREKKLIDGIVGKESIYAPAKKTILISNRHRAYGYSKEKYDKAVKTANLLGVIPQVKLVGLSGSVAVYNAKKKDDIDFFIITAPNQLWTGRLIVLFILQILGIRRGRGEKKVANKICCNLFFDGRNLSILKDKRSEYMAHEALQFVPLINKENTHKRFFSKNQWIYSIFPNANRQSYNTIKSFNTEIKTLSVLSLFESLFKYVQLFLINRHKTNEYISDSQLWFFPKDYNAKLQKGYLSSS